MITVLKLVLVQLNTHDHFLKISFSKTYDNLFESTVFVDNIFRNSVNQGLLPRVQGAKLTHVKAEWFLGLSDFLLWSHLSNFESGLPEEAEEVLVVKHEKYSSQAWVDLVLQLAKVFVLVKVKPSKYLQANSDSYKS